GGTADAAHVREDLDRRVWRVLEAAADDAELRSEIFERTATPFNCDDAVADSFSQLEVLLELRDIAKRVERGAATGTSLLDLGR
ncbi:NEL-type E3 ubiquitin ligase domain-containing protein, partial [Klebsiella pneumoniae]|uniref:NEL-type E3 ubiquitin ligase domain-containing protein n=1 Tax=Klebsiella pneumoniae TaxID=573 RepID=UPI0034DF3D67